MENKHQTWDEAGFLIEEVIVPRTQEEIDRVDEEKVLQRIISIKPGDMTNLQLKKAVRAIARILIGDES